MAVRAQYPCNSAFTHDFRNRAQNDAFQDQLQMLEGYINAGNGIPLAGTALSELHPKSELTCNNVAASRKRCRGDDPSSSSMAPSHLHHPIISAQQASLLDAATAQGRQYVSVAVPSTSGRAAAEDLVSQFYHQSLDVDALVRFQTEQLRSGLVEMRKRHCGALASALEQQVSMRLRDKETELANARRRNAELDEKVRQLSAENQVWFSVAKNNEAVASSLRAALEQLLLQNAPAAPAAAPAEEGFGDSGRAAFPADDAQSCCFESDGAQAAQRENEELKQRRACRVCGEREASVLVLPCRHLCLCKDCEPKLNTCPVCDATKNATLQIFLS